MINPQHCDVAPLTVDDFEPSDSMELRLFIIERVKLAEIRKVFPS